MILVCIIAYKEKDLYGTVKDCWDKAEHRENLFFSIVEEDDKHSDLSFIPESQIKYQKYDTSEYRGILWARSKTLDVNVEYDYVLHTCGHMRFEYGWDSTCIKKYNMIKSDCKYDKIAVSMFPPVYEICDDFSIKIKGVTSGPEVNTFFPSWNTTKDFGVSFAPGYWFPNVEFLNQSKSYSEHFWINFVWFFTGPNYHQDVQFDKDIAWNVEEPYTSFISIYKGYRFFAIPEIIAYHHTWRKFPDEEKPLNHTSRPWVDDKKINYRDHANKSLIKLNGLLSGNSFINIEDVYEICEKIGLSKEWTEFNSEYDKIKGRQHMQQGTKEFYDGYSNE